MNTKTESKGRDGLSVAKRIVIKIGTSNLTDDRHKLDHQKVERLTRGIVELKRQGKEIIVVSSGAIGAGIGKLNLKQRPRDISVLQATAAVGQNILMSTYDKYFSECNQTIAQVLSTHEDFNSSRRFRNLRNTLNTLLRFDVIPIINENDTVAVGEIKMGDNDYLSALVATKLKANLLIILTDTNGLYTYNPKRNKKAEIISVVPEITPEIEHIAETGGKTSVGGMKTKIKAAKVAMKSGIPMVIVNGSDDNILARVIAGEPVGTIFLPEAKENMNGRIEHWIRFFSLTKGTIKVDESTKTTLVKEGSSLLPSEIIGVEGEFISGDSVSIVDEEGVEFAKGITNYSNSDIERIKGAQSKGIEQILGRKDHNEVVYSEKLVLI
jgi:glutamate 5-kinase